MPDARTDMLEERIDRLEKKVDDGFARVDQRFDDVYGAMSQGFAEHRQLLIEQMDKRVEPLHQDVKRLDKRIDDLRADMRREFGTVRREMNDGFDALAARLDAQATDTGTRFDRLESKLDAFVESQAAVNRRLLEYLNRPER